MPTALDDYGGLVAGDGPGQAVHAVAERLAACGLAVCGPEGQESRRLTIAVAERGRCELTIEDGGSARWDYRPGSGRGTGPAELTALVLRLLGAADTGEPRTRAHPGVSLKGMVGRALAARGLKVGLEVYQDPDYYDVSAEIVVSNPARPERGQVSVSDAGDLTWECHYHDDRDAGQIADTVTGIVTDGIGELGQEAVPPARVDLTSAGTAPTLPRTAPRRTSGSAGPRPCDSGRRNLS
jgi:hypothetical protein